MRRRQVASWQLPAGGLCAASGRQRDRRSVLRAKQSGQAVDEEPPPHARLFCGRRRSHKMISTPRWSVHRRRWSREPLRAPGRPRHRGGPAGPEPGTSVRIARTSAACRELHLGPAPAVAHPFQSPARPQGKEWLRPTAVSPPTPRGHQVRLPSTFDPDRKCRTQRCEPVHAGP